jgi:hypothetical protein
MFPLHLLDKDCSTVLKSFSLHMKCSFFVLGCFVFFVSHVKKMAGLSVQQQNVINYRKVQFLKDDVCCVFITYQKIIQSTQLSFCYRNNICFYSLQHFLTWFHHQAKNYIVYYYYILYSFLRDNGCYIKICRDVKADIASIYCTEVFELTELFLYWGYMRTKITRIFVGMWDEITGWRKLLDEDVRFEVLMIVSRLGCSVTWHHVVW